MFLKGYSSTVEQWSSKSHMWVRFLLPLLYNFKHKKKFFKKKNTSNFKKIKTSNNLIFKNYTYTHKFNKLVRPNKKTSFTSFVFKKVPNLVTQRHYLNSYELKRIHVLPFIMKILHTTPSHSCKFSWHTYCKIYNIYFTLNNRNYSQILTNVTCLLMATLTGINYVWSSHNDIDSFKYFYLNNFLLASRTNKILTSSGKKHHWLNLFGNRFKDRKITNVKFNLERFKNENLLFSSFGNVPKSWTPSLRSTKARTLPFKHLNTNTWIKFQIIKNSLFDSPRKTNLAENLLDVNLPSHIVSKYRPYLFISKLFFKGLSFTADILSRSNVNFFLLSDEDIYYSDVIKVTRQYKNWNQKELFFLRNLGDAGNLKKSSKIKTLSIFNNSLINDNFFESNFYILLFGDDSVNVDLSFASKYFYKFNRQKSNFSYRAILSLFNQITLSRKSRPVRKLASVLELQTHKTDSSVRGLKSVPGLNKTNKRSTYLNKFNVLPNFETLSLLFFKPLILKFFLYTYYNKKCASLARFNSTLPSIVNKFLFYSRNSLANFSNLNPDKNFIFFIKKRVIKIFNYQKFSISVTPWYFNSLVRFMEYCSGKKVYLKFYNFLNNYLDFVEKSRCLMWSQKVKNFRRLLGPRLFLNESLQIMYISLKTKDPFFLSNWMTNMMQKISFWKFKVFLRYLKYVLKNFFWAVFKEIGVRGIKFQLKGKISVAGNARTRTVRHRIGRTGHSTVDNKVVSTLSLVRTFTGAIGLKVWIFF